MINTIKKLLGMKHKTLKEQLYEVQNERERLLSRQFVLTAKIEKEEEDGKRNRDSNS